MMIDDERVRGEMVKIVTKQQLNHRGTGKTRNKVNGLESKPVGALKKTN
jgi:hypothetical protein